MNRLFIFLISFLLLNLNFSLAQEKLSVFNIPENLIKEANTVLRYSNTSFDIKEIGKGVYKTSYAVTILNANGKNEAKLRIHYSNLISLKNLSAAVYNGNGKLIRKVKKNEIRDYSAFDGISVLSDNRIKYVDMTHNEYPYTIEVSYERYYDGLMFLPSWYIQHPDKYSVQNASFKVTTPIDYELKIKSHGLADVKTKEEGNNKVYQWDIENSEPIEDEFINADPFTDYRYVKLAPTKFEMEGYKGDLSTWSNYGKWLSQLSQGRDQLSSDKVEEIKKLVSGVTDQKEKIRLVYQYLQENTRYVSIQLGLGGWQPFSADYVAEKGFGDCKALTNYTKTALKNVGIESYYTLVNAGRNEEEIDPTFPSNQFNHAFLCVPNAQDTVWLECTSQTNPFGYLGDFTSDRDVLVLNESGGEIVRTPAYTKENSQYKTTGTIKLDIDGNAKVNLLSTFNGLSYEYVSGFDKYDSKQKDKALKSLFPINGISIKDFEFKEKKDQLPTASLKIELEARKMATSSGKRFFLVPNQINRGSYIPTKYDKRESDFKIRYERNTIDSIVYEIPEGIHPEFIPKPKSINTSFGTYETSIEKGAGYIKYYRKFTLNKGVFDKTKYEEYVNFREKCVKADKQKVVFLKST